MARMRSAFSPSWVGVHPSVRYSLIFFDFSDVDQVFLLGVKWPIQNQRPFSDPLRSIPMKLLGTSTWTWTIRFEKVNEVNLKKNGTSKTSKIQSSKGSKGPRGTFFMLWAGPQLVRGPMISQTARRNRDRRLCLTCSTAPFGMHLLFGQGRALGLWGKFLGATG